MVFWMARIAALEPISSSALARSAPARRPRDGGARSMASSDAAQFALADRLGEVIDGPEPHRLDRVGGRGVRGQHGDGGGGFGAAQAAQHFEPVQAGHAQIEDHGVDAAGLDRGERGERRWRPRGPRGRDPATASDRALRSAASSSTIRTQGMAATIRNSVVAVSTLKLRIPAVGSRDLAHDGQAETGAVGPAADEGIEQAVADRLRRPGARVADGEDQPAVGGRRRERDRARRRPPAGR